MANLQTATGRGETINLRATRKQKALIDQAAEALGRNRTDFMLDTVCREAENVLLDRRYFVLPEEAFRKFNAMLDRPPKNHPQKTNIRLQRLLETKAPWGAMKAGELSAPEKLSARHDVSDFHSGEAVMDEWLRRRALQNEASGASRTYIVCAGKKVAGYYSLAAGAIAHEKAPGRIKRNMPDPVPVMILGRLAVDQDFHGMGIGTGLLKDAVLRTTQAAEIAGIRALLVHAISDAAKHFYERNGFVASPVDAMTVMIALAEAREILNG